MNDTIKAAKIGARGTIIAAIIGGIISIGTFFVGQISIEKKTVEILSSYFDSVDKDMSYRETLQIIHENYINTENENAQLREQLGETKNEEDIDRKNQETITTVNAFMNLGDYEKAISLLNEIENKTPEMELLIVDCSSKYERQIIDKTTELKRNGEFDEAISIIDDALKILPNSSILISEKEKVTNSRPKNFMDVCEPYEGSYYYKKYVNGETFNMSGVKRTNGFTLMGYDNQAISNLNGQYKTLSFDVGHVDGAVMIDATLFIYLDGVFYQSYDIKADALPIGVKIPIDGKKQIKFFIKDGRSVAQYSTTIGFADIIIT